MFDILVYLFENYQDLSAHTERDKLARKLSAAGFVREDISEALDWLAGLKSARKDNADFGSDPRAIRVYADAERHRLGVDGLNLLGFLENAKALTPILRELVVDRALALADPELPLDRLKLIILMVLWSEEQDLDLLIVEELLSDPQDEIFH